MFDHFLREKASIYKRADHLVLYESGFGLGNDPINSLATFDVRDPFVIPDSQHSSARFPHPAEEISNTCFNAVVPEGLKFYKNYQMLRLHGLSFTAATPSRILLQPFLCFAVTQLSCLFYISPTISFIP
jgi:hypothetical protein